MKISRSFLCKWMPDIVKLKATPPVDNEVFADVIPFENKSFKAEEGDKTSRTSL